MEQQYASSGLAGWEETMDFDNFDYDRLRSDLMDLYGTAMFSGFPMAVIELGKVERASESELILIAQKEHYDLQKYRK